MKKILFIAIILMSIVSSAQVFDLGYINAPMTTVQMNAIVLPGEGRNIYNSDTKTNWIYDGTQWVDTGSATVTGTELAFNGWDKDASDDVTLSGDQTITGSKILNGSYTILRGNSVSSYVHGLTWDDDGKFSRWPLPSSLSGGEGEMWMHQGKIHSRKSTQAQAGLTFDQNNTAIRTYTFPDASGTVALTSDLSTVTGTEPAFNGWDKDASDDLTTLSTSPLQNITVAVGTTAALDSMPTPATLEFETDSDIATDGYVTNIAVTGTDTKTITLQRNGLSDLTTTFTDQGTGGSADGNDFLTSVSQTGGVLTFNVQNQTNPTFNLLSYLTGLNYSTGAHITTEEVQDVVGGMVSGNTESNIVVNYQDLDGTLDFIFSPADNTINGSKIVDNSLTALKLAPDSVGPSELQPDAVGPDDIQDNAIAWVAMQDNSVGNGEMRNDAIGSDEIINSSILIEDLASSLSSLLPVSGTFTPSFSTSTGGATYTYGVRQGNFTASGKNCYINIVLSNINTSGTPTGTIRITGLPASYLPTATSVLNVSTDSLGADFYSIHAKTTSGQNYLYLEFQNTLDGSNQSTNVTTIGTGGNIYITGSYVIN